MISVDVCSGKETRRDVSLDEVAANRPRSDAHGTRQSPQEESQNGHNVAVPADNTDIHGAVSTNGKNGARSSVAWIDMTAPTEDEWNRLEQTFHFHPLAIEDARKQDQRIKLDAYEGYRFLSVRTWIGQQTTHEDFSEVTTEIDIFLGPDYLVTIHEEPLPIIEDARKRWQRRAQMQDGAEASPAYLVYLLLDAIVDGLFPIMDQIDTEIDALEMSLYDKNPTGSDAPQLKTAIHLRKRLLFLRQAVTPMREVVNELLRDDDLQLLPPGLRAYWQDVYDHTLRLVEQVDLHRDILGGVVDAVMAMASHRLNQVMKTMTAVSTILMSAALISGIYGMNFKYMPELEWRYGYFGALGLMVAVAAGLVWHFRRIEWL